MPAERGARTTVRRPGMRSVAERAGVSYQTVSRVLNGAPDVAAGTRERVLAAIEEIGYRRNSAARALRTSRSGVIGVITEGSMRYGPVGTLAGVEDAAREAGYQSHVATLREADPRSMTEAFDRFAESGAEGVVVIAPEVDAASAARAAVARVPIVLLAPGEASRPGVYAISEDQELGARYATRHLLDLGHREVAHLAGAQDWLDGQVRVRGWQHELRKAGIEPPRFLEGDWTGDQAYAVGQRLVREGLPSSVFAASDLMALGLLRAFAEAGVRVPEDISVVGFDDVEWAQQFFPPLTSVRQDFAALGRRCMGILIAAIEGGPVDTTPIEPHLYVRASTGPPPARVASG